MPATQPNQELAAALAHADWEPCDLVREINHLLAVDGHRIALHRTTAYSWVRQGRTPQHLAVRRAAAAVLTRATGTLYTPQRLWPHALDTDLATPDDTACDELSGPLTLPTVLGTATQWTERGPRYSAVQPAAAHVVLTAALDAARLPLAGHLPRPVHGERVVPPMTDHIEANLAALRRLDDKSGGTAVAQRWVRHHLADVLELIRHARYTDTIGHRLLRAAAGLAQLHGWMAFDANAPGPAQRFHLIALRLARACDAHDIVANNLGMLAYQCAAHGSPAHAIRLATAATEAAQHCGLAVRARAHGRLATAYAAAGDLYAHHHAADTTRSLLDHAPDGSVPADIYYFTPRQCDAENGHANVLLAATHPAHAPKLVTRAAELLSPLALNASGYQRSAFLHGIHLAQAHLIARDREACASILDALTPLVAGVPSPRCRAMLRKLRVAEARRLPPTTREAIDAALSAP
ncbi:hypothetical protein ACH4PU_30260 [Streptomyces sp. NPDC021100]|uniref:hypothetical protein n=1 Tax=Streptomyces sp. NPDC021100 TaxID=3365114 RepID=UPI0037A5D617